MDGFLPPVDNASWLDYQRRRAERFARERIAAAGATAGDWIGRATQTIDDLVPDWAAPTLTPTPPPAVPDLEPAPPAPPSGSPGDLTGPVTAPLADWATQAQDRIGAIGSGLGSALAPIGAAAGTAARYLPGNVGPAVAADALAGTPTRLRDALTQSAPGQWLGDREAEMEAQQRQDDERLARMALGAYPEDGGAPEGVSPEGFEQEVGRARWLRETGQHLSGGIRRGQRGLRPPKLTPEQVAQRARDGEAETRVFQAIQRLWRTGQEEVADDLRFLALGKGEAGEQAAREYLAGKGLADALPAPSVAGAEAGSATPRGAAAVGALSGLGAAAGAIGEGARSASRYLPGSLGAAAAQDVLAGTPYRLRDDLAQSGPGRWLGEREEETRTQQQLEDERMARMALGAFPGQGGRPADVDPDAWEREVKRARWLRETGQNVAGGSGLKLPSANQALEAVSAAPLIAPRSLLTNLLSGGSRTLERLAVRALSGHPLEAVKEARTIARELAPGSGTYTKAGASFMTGPTPRNPGAIGPSYAADSLYGSTDAGAIAATAGGRANAATDEVIRTVNEAAARETGIARGYTGQRLDDFVKQAGDFATVTGANSPLTSALNHAKQWAHDPSKSPLERGTGLVAQAFAPYTGMPERLLVASTRAVVDPVYAPLEAAVRKFLLKKPLAAEELRGRMALGTVADLWLWREAGQGRLYGRPPSDQKLRRKMEADGAHWDSYVTANGLVLPLANFGTLGQGAGLIADAELAHRQAVAEGEGVPAQVAAILNRAASRTLDESYVADFGDFLEAVGDDRFVEAAGDLGAGVVGRIPSLLAGPLNASDEYARDTRGAGGMAARVVPGGRRALPAKIDPTSGEAVRRQGSGLTRYLGFASGEETTPLQREFIRRGVGARDFRDGKYTGVEQTPQQLDAVRRAYGSEVGREARAVIASREYQEARPVEKQKLLQQALTRAYAEADVRVGDKAKRSPKAQADFEYRAVPQYEGVRGGPDEVRRQNARIADAKRQVTAARQKYPGDPDKGERELLQRSRETVRLAERARLPADELRPKRTAIYAKHGLNAAGQDEAALDEAAGGEDEA